MTPDQRGNDSVVGTDTVDGPVGRGPTRRQVIALTGGAAAATGMALGPFSHFFAGAASAEVPAEITLSAWLMGIEQAASAVYAQAAEAGGLDDATADLVSTCAGHHDAHSTALNEMVSAGGGETPTAPNQDFVDDFGGRVAGASDTAAKAGVFAEMENGFAATYQAAYATLTSAPLAAIAAQIQATDATHAVAWATAAAAGGEGPTLPDPGSIPGSQTDEGAFGQDTYAAASAAAPAEDEEAGDTGDAGATATTTADQSTSVPGTTTGGDS